MDSDVFVVLSVIWVIVVAAWMWSTSNSLREIADAQTRISIAMELQADLDDEVD